MLKDFLASGRNLQNILFIKGFIGISYVHNINLTTNLYNTTNEHNTIYRHFELRYELTYRFGIYVSTTPSMSALK